MTVVLYKVMQVYNEMDTIPIAQIVLGIVKFVVVCAGGLLIGVLAGIVTAVLTKYTYHVRGKSSILFNTISHLKKMSLSDFHSLRCIIILMFLCYETFAFLSSSRLSYPWGHLESFIHLRHFFLVMIWSEKKKH